MCNLKQNNLVDKMWKKIPVKKMYLRLCIGFEKTVLSKDLSLTNEHVSGVKY